MSDSTEHEPASLPPALPMPPDMPLAVTSTASGAADVAPMTAGDAAPARAESRPRWLSEVALPFALGVVCAVSWVGAAILAVWDGLSLGVLRTAQAALLLVVPTVVVVVAVALSRDFWRAAQRGQLSGALRLLLTLAMIILGLAFAFLATKPLPPYNNAVVLFTLPFAAPGLSLGVALGFAWGARPRPTGAGVGLMGGVGFAAPLVALAVILIVMSHQTPTGCDTDGKFGCGLEQAVDQLVAVILLAACVLTVALSFIGGILGAYLRRR